MRKRIFAVVILCLFLSGCLPFGGIFIGCETKTSPDVLVPRSTEPTINETLRASIVESIPELTRDIPGLVSISDETTKYGATGISLTLIFNSDATQKEKETARALVKGRLAALPGVTSVGGYWSYSCSSENGEKQQGAFFLLLIWLVIVGVFAWLGLHFHTIATMIRNLPTSTIRALAIGPVEVRGLVKSDKTVKSEFSGDEGVYIKYAITQRTAMTIHISDNLPQTVPFYIDDGTGRVYIDLPPEGLFILKPKNITPGVTLEFNKQNFAQCHVELAHKTTIQFPTIGKLAERYKSIYGVDTMALLSKFIAESPVTIEETVLHNGDSVYAIGTFVGNQPGPSGNQIPTINSSKGYLYVSDSPERKIISQVSRRATIFFAISGAAFLAGAAIIILASGLF